MTIIACLAASTAVQWLFLCFLDVLLTTEKNAVVKNYVPRKKPRRKDLILSKTFPWKKELVIMLRHFIPTLVHKYTEIKITKLIYLIPLTARNKYLLQLVKPQPLLFASPNIYSLSQ